MDLLHIARVLVGYIVSAFAGHFVVAGAIDSLWRTVGVSEDPSLRPPRRIRFWHGVTERTIYTSMILLGKPEGIAVWLAFKAVMRWKIDEKDERHIPGSLIYMIGTALNLAFGVLGGFVARWTLSF